MSIPKDVIKDNPGLGKWSIITAYRGSIAHNMYVPNSDPNSVDDKDVMSICVPPEDYYLGLKSYGSRGTRNFFHDEWDIVIYEVKKFISLLEKGNPNVLTMLWLKPNHYIKLTPAGQLIISHRYLFVGRHVYKSFTGYAYSQLKKMERFNKQGYMGEKRKKLVAKFGYDTKMAAHLLRLGRLFKLADQAYVNSTLQKCPDKKLINRLCVDVTKTAHKEQKIWG
jgi:predicted nucleotidyltransferase